MGDRLFCWSDQGAWGPLLDQPKDMLRAPKNAHVALLESYSGLRVFHACRTTDVSTYLQEGLHPGVIAELNEAARRLAHDFDAGVLESDIDRAITQVPISTEGYVYACVDRRELQGHTHFFRYGSERVYLILKRLGELNGMDYVQQLGSLGRPTMFELAIPWQDISDWLRNELANAISRNWEKVRVGGDPDEQRWTHAQNTPISPLAIIAHYGVSV